MKRIALFLCLYLYTATLGAQRLPLDTSVFDNWPAVSQGVISNNGQYALYTIQTHAGRQTELRVHAPENGQEQAITGASNGVFTTNSRTMIFIKGNDSLGILNLRTSAITYIPRVSAFQLYEIQGAEWLVFLSDPKQDTLNLLQLLTGKRYTYSTVQEYKVSKQGHVLVYTAHTAGAYGVYRVQLPNNAPQLIFEGPQPVCLVLDNAGQQLAFLTGEEQHKVCWCYNPTMPRAVPLLSGDTADNGNLQLQDLNSFSTDGKRLFITLQEPPASPPAPGAVMVDVWSYTDPMLQLEQLLKSDPRSYYAVLEIAGPCIVRLQQEDEEIVWRTDDVLCVAHLQGDDTEKCWNKAAQPEYFMVSAHDGSRKPAPYASYVLSAPSPQGRYIAGPDYDMFNVYSYEPATGITRNLTVSLPLPPKDPMKSMYEGPPDDRQRGISFAAWLDDGSGVLVYDEFDIWLVDPAGSKASVNLTNGYGRQHNITFRLSGPRYTHAPMPHTGSIIITAFDHNNKYNGLYRLFMPPKVGLQLLTMGPYVYEVPDYGLQGEPSLKARDADVWLVKRSCTAQSPNYYYTKDFRQFTPLSQVYPEREYNWMTAELIAFQTLDGRTEQGILYKPQDFDPAKRYPLILYYYEWKSQELHSYHKPRSPTGADLDIAWFTSHGYLVCTPDIHYPAGEPGKGAYSSVVAAAQYLGRLPYVDSTRMGIQGHSFGGYETNYLVTHTGLFAAAVSSAGPSNFVSLYGNCWGWGPSYQCFTEHLLMRNGKTLWEVQELYIAASPVFRADKVTTPLLLVANKRDGNVPFSQGLEFFLALRRLGKRAWMLQYDKGLHGVYGKDYIDLVMRMTQFFDHYLKGAPAPVWMTRGIPARLKGIDAGFAPDKEITTPGRGLLYLSDDSEK